MSELHEFATQLRIDSVQATTAAASGHPTSCASAAEIMAVLFFDVMRYDVREPRAHYNDVATGSLGQGLSAGQKIPVYIAYFTTFERDGKLSFRPDVYTQDEPLIRAPGPVKVQPGPPSIANRLEKLAR